MKKLSKALAAAIILAALLPLQAFAADQPAAAAAPAGPATATPSVAAQAAAPAPGPAAPAQKLLSQNFGDWVYRCLATAEAGKAVTAICSVQQQLAINKDGHTTPLLTLTFLKSNPKGHVINVLAPLGVALKPGLELSLDTQKPVQAAYSFCNSNGCYVVNQTASALTKDVHAAKQGHAKITLMNGKSVVIDFSLKGLPAALAALDSNLAPHG